MQVSWSGILLTSFGAQVLTIKNTWNVNACPFRDWRRSINRCDVPVVVAHQASLLLTAALLPILLCGLQHVASDSDELVPTEWEMWKSSHGISHDDMVNHGSGCKHLCAFIMFNFSMMLSVLWCRMTFRGGPSGRRTSKWLKIIIKAFSWEWGRSLWPWTNMETWWVFI